MHDLVVEESVQGPLAAAKKFFRTLLKRLSLSDGMSFRLVSLLWARHQEEREKAVRRPPENLL